ncbi:cytochrome C bihemic c4 family protein [Salinisphaera sp. S4-8]|uniref:c-type cytochrome n=1 Tax=Salinisphaera sp. S4-8 TaxID=633357 RepID=UPI00333F7DA9
MARKRGPRAAYRREDMATVSVIRLFFIGALLVSALAASPGAFAHDDTASDDAMADRVEACTACHGPKGLELEDGYVPRIHGKPAGYLYNQLVNYQDYRRRNRSMNHMVAHLSHEYLYEIAHYFADQHVPYPAPAAAPSDALARRGEQLVHEGDEQAGVPACAACHGQRLTGVEPNTPALIGLPRQYIMAQLGAWQVGTRHAAAPDCMARITQRLDGRDVEAVAAWLAAQPIPADTRALETAVVDPPLECGSVPAPES